MPRLPSRPVASVLLAIYAFVVLWLVFEPIPHTAVGSVLFGERVLAAVGLGGLVPGVAIEFAWNVLMFVPMTFLGSALTSKLTWEQWTGIGLLASSAIEFAQFFVLPDRSATVVDLVSNTLGALLGAILAARLR